MGKLSAASPLTAPAVDDYFWVLDSSDPANLKKIAHADLCVAGLFTPILIGSVTAGTQTYSTQVGNYSRIGNIVTFDIELELSAKDGATSGDLRVSGLPFTTASKTAVSLSFTEGWTIAAGRRMQGYINGAFVTLLESNDLSKAFITEADFSGNETIMIAGSYIAA